MVTRIALDLDLPALMSGVDGPDPKFRWNVTGAAERLLAALPAEHQSSFRLGAVVDLQIDVVGDDLWELSLRAGDVVLVLGSISAKKTVLIRLVAAYLGWRIMRGITVPGAFVDSAGGRFASLVMYVEEDKV